MIDDEDSYTWKWLDPCYVFWVQRPVDKTPWPFVCQDAKIAEEWPHRCTRVVAVNLRQRIPEVPK